MIRNRHLTHWLGIVRFRLPMLAALSILLAGVVPAQEASLKRLEASSRHQEWMPVKYGERVVQCFVVYPEIKEKATAVILIHENMGLTDWVRGLADQVAEAGFIAVAPDFLSGAGPNGGKTSDFTSPDGARQAIYALAQDQVTSDLMAIADAAAKIDSGNGKVAVAGFCWGGSQTFQFATRRPDLAAAFVFYGGAPRDDAALARIKCPVYGFYGGRDARISDAVPGTQEKMKAAGKTYEPEIYDGAGHGFMRSGETAPEDNPNRKGRDAAWQRWTGLLKKI